MPYAHGRVIHDADSHVMEPADWLDAHMDGALKAEFQGKPRTPVERIERQVAAARARKNDPAPVPA